MESGGGDRPRHGERADFYHWNGEGDVPTDVTCVRVDASATEIPEGAFEDCDLLEEVELPEGLRVIGKRAFRLCRSLLLVEVPSPVEMIGNEAFSCCLNLEAFILPDGLMRLGKCAFYLCRSLKRIAIPVAED